MGFDFIIDRNELAEITINSFLLDGIILGF